MSNCTQKPSAVPMTATEEELSQAAEKQVNQSLASFPAQIDLEASARMSKALCRKRQIRSAEDLLRFVMVYALKDLSLRMVGLWGTVLNWGNLSKSGVRKRIRQCQAWLGMLMVCMLAAGKIDIPKRAGLRVRLFDASTVSRPGSHKADYRLHLGFDLSAGRMTDVLLTDAHQGESLTRWEYGADEICLADRYYGNLRNLGVLLGAWASFVIRIGWKNPPLQDESGQAFSLPQWLAMQSTDPAATPAQVCLWVQTPQGRFPVRVIARAITPEKAEKARQKLRAQARKRKTRLDERTLLAAGFVMLVSNLPNLTWTATEILALYRFRWQIELVFRRLKSLLCFDHLRASDPQLAQVYLLTKLLIALLLTQAQWQMALAMPEKFHTPERPLSLWRCTQLSLEAFCQAFCGSLTWERIVQALPFLDRYLCDEPRRRLNQLVAFRNLGARYAFFGFVPLK